MTSEAANTLPAWIEWPACALAVVIGWVFIDWCFREFFPPKPRPPPRSKNRTN